MKDIDPILQEIDSDKDAQQALSEFANDSFNNNYSPLFARPSKNELLSSAIAAVERHTEPNLKLLLNKKASSSSNRINYPIVLFLSNNNPHELARYLTIALAEKITKTTDDYVEELNDRTDLVTKRFSLKTSKERLFCLSDCPNIELRNQALDLRNGSMIFLHQFLRRGFSSNFVDIPSVLNRAINDKCKVEVRLDPYRIGDIEKYSEVQERDYWYGPKFNKKLLENKNSTEKITRHCTSDDATFSAKYMTVFRTSMMCENTRQFSIEEYLPEDQIASTKKYVIQKFAHFTYNQTRHSFEHVDCAVRIFDKSQYGDIFERLKAGTTPRRQIGIRHKLIKVSQYPSIGLIEDLLYAFFRNNPNIIEYFCDMTTAEVFEYINS